MIKIDLCPINKFISIVMLCLVTVLPGNAMDNASGADTPSIPFTNSMEIKAGNKPVDLDYHEIDLNRLCRVLSSSNLILKCMPSAQNQKLQMYLTHCTVKDVMLAIAKLIPGEWVHGTTADTFYFEMAAQALRERHIWWGMFMRAWNEGIQSRYDHLLIALNAPSVYLAKVRFSSGVIQDMSDCMSVIHSLPESVKVQIAKTETKLGDYGEVYRKAIAPYNGNAAISLDGLPSRQQNMVYNKLNATDQSLAHHSPSSCLIFNYGSGMMFVYLALPDNQIVPIWQIPFNSKQDNALLKAAMSLNQDRLVALVKQYPHARELYKELAGYETSTVWNDHLPSIEYHPYYHLSDALHGVFGPLRRSERLEWMEEHTGFQYISDYYTQAGSILTNNSHVRTWKHSLKYELDRMAKLNDCSYRENSDGIYLVRDNRWYRDDELEVPDTLLSHWMALIPFINMQSSGIAHLPDLHQTASIESEILLSMLHHLNLFQIENGLRQYIPNSLKENTKLNAQFIEPRPFAALANDVFTESLLIQFMKSLSSNELTELLSHRLPYNRLTYPQRILAIEASQNALFLLGDPDALDGSTVCVQTPDGNILSETAGLTSDNLPVFLSPLQELSLKVAFLNPIKSSN